MSLRTLPLLLLACIPATGCECTRNAHWALRVRVVNAVGLAAVAGPVIVVAREGAFVDTLKQLGDVWVGVPEREGAYRLEVAAQGYHFWVREGIRVRRNDECDHLNTADVTAELTPL